MDNTFADWLRDSMRKKGWKQADLADAAHLDTAVISNIMNGKRGPGIKTCTAIARAFRVSPETVLQAAGLLSRLSPPNKDDAIISEINDIYQRLNPNNQIETLEYFRMKLRIQEEKGKYGTSGNIRPAADKK